MDDDLTPGVKQNVEKLREAASYLSNDHYELALWLDEYADTLEYHNVEK
jgi:hypothetical protein